MTLRGALVAGLAASLLGIAAGAAFAPEPLAKGYGIPIEGEAGRAYVRALGARDAVIGLLLVRFALANERRALAETFAIGTLVALCDFTLVSGHDRRSPALLAHGSGGIAFVVAALAVANDWL